MRKIKPTPGSWAFYEDPDGVYPYLSAFKVDSLSLDGWPTVRMGGATITLGMPKFCLSAEDGDQVNKEIERLRKKHAQAMEQMTRIMGDHRKRSVLGQLDPREK